MTQEVVLSLIVNLNNQLRVHLSLPITKTLFFQMISQIIHILFILLCNMTLSLPEMQATAIQTKRYYIHLMTIIMKLIVISMFLHTIAPVKHSNEL